MGGHRSSTTSFSLEQEAKSDVYRGKGCWVSPPKAFILILLACLLALVVGLLVHFFDPSKACVEEDGADISTTVAPTPEPENIDYFLPTNLRPSLYKLHLRPDIYKADKASFEFTGTVDITVTCTAATDKVVLHTRLLDVTGTPTVREHGVTGDAAIAVSDTTYDPVREFFTIPLSRSLEKNKEYIISLAFKGPILPDLKGIYYSSYEMAGNTTYVLASQLQATDARKVFPCFDEPNFKAKFDVTIDRKPHFTTMSNGVIERNETLADGWVRDHYTRTLIMSTYLLAFIVSDFECVESYTNVTNKLVEICARPNAMNQTELANNVSAPIQSFFEWYHDVPYPLNKTIHAGVPDFAAGAMENWGLIIYRDYNILYNPESSTSVQKQRIVVVIAHELAHMWFGNLVSMKWWDDVWLNEGFASYMETLGTAAIYPEWNMEDDLILDKVQYVMQADGLATSHPIFQSAGSPAEIIALFDGITYSKGASIIRMMRYFLGEDTFRWGLSKYLVDREYDTATHDDLFDFLTKEAESRGINLNVGDVMKTWIMQMGYPVVKFEFDKTAHTITVSQKHFLLDPKSAKDLPPSEYNYMWKVPISYATDLSTNLDDPDLYMNTWLDGESMVIPDVPANAQWIVGNVKERFYYRVNYDDSTWETLINTLKTNHEAIDHKNRAQLVDDSFNLGRAGEINQTTFLDISQYLGSELEHIPWWAATRGFSYFNRILGVTGDYGLFKKYMRSLLDAPYRRLGWDESASGHVEKLQRAILLQYACYYGVEECVTTGKTKFSDWQNSANENTIPPNLRYTAYCTGISSGGQEEWDFAFAQFQIADSGAEERTLMQALACTNEDWLLRRYLEIALKEDQIRRQDFSTVFTSVASGSVGRVIAWEFLVDNWDVIYDRFGGSLSFDRIVLAPTQGFSTEYHYNLVKIFMENQAGLGSGELAFKQALETIRNNIDWRQTNQPIVRQWLEANTQP